MQPWQFEEVSPATSWRHGDSPSNTFTHHRMCSDDYYHHLY
ncbi:Unknown protein sequence [Pseudomonas savastanoi pv. glycinea]|uniref:Uncharacterized protein n=1 Tax=Pseudomonas savastanoi pv. glycinea TaxID=318 RepID=A0ABR5L9L4_PSESG|nr:Unknown protein sequence [Pseudomonas savastanoi pv. phaseolicola]KPB71130.1 Unknown protein sequence [Pseudomonas amygdali pv. mellea]KPB79515.1 Unknown protein sequence [Pseudomonas syringae pv. maculicola]KPC20427.1 Unknown protein sequence [Pseudomonas savastanoi pv. glycinea]QDW03533.1 hypothetical protein FFH21_025505 [Pseudomonas sp. KBS0707]